MSVLPYVPRSFTYRSDTEDIRLRRQRGKDPRAVLRLLLLRLLDLLYSSIHLLTILLLLLLVVHLMQVLMVLVVVVVAMMIMMIVVIVRMHHRFHVDCTDGRVLALSDFATNVETHLV